MVLFYKPPDDEGLDPNNMKAFKKSVLAVVLLSVLAVGGMHLALSLVIENKAKDYGFTSASVGILRWTGGLSGQIKTIRLNEQSEIKNLSVAWEDRKLVVAAQRAVLVLDKNTVERLRERLTVPSGSNGTSDIPPLDITLAEASIALPDYDLEISVSGFHAAIQDPENLQASATFKTAYGDNKAEGVLQGQIQEGTYEVLVKADRLDALGVPFRDVVLTAKGGNTRHALVLQGTTPDENARVGVNASAERKGGNLLAFEGKLDASAKDLEKLKNLTGRQNADIAGSGQAQLSFTGAVDMEEKRLTTLSLTTASPINFKGRLAGRDVDIKNLSLSVEHKPDAVKARAEAGLLAMPAFSDYLSPVSFLIDASGDPDGKVDFSGRISDPNGAFVISVSGGHDVASDSGNARVKLENVKFTPGLYQPHNMSPFLKKYTEDVSGQIGADGKLTWKKTKAGHAMSGAGNFLAENLSGVINDMEVAGIHGVVSFDAIDPLKTKPDQVVYVGALNAGVPLTDGLIKFTLGPEKNRLHINALRWNFAGGVLSADPFAISLDNPDTQIVLKAETLDLKQLFDMAALDGLNATGLVQGSLPLELKEGKISVHNGWLAAQDKGTIKYAPENPPAFLSQPGNPGLDTLKGALQNFHFNELSLKIDGDAGGQQKVTLQAKGNNPDFQGGFPVNINLNLEGELENVLRQNLGNYKMPEVIRKQIEAYEEKHAQ